VSLVEEHHGRAVSGGDLLGPHPEPLPEARHRRLRAIRGRVDRRVSVACGDLQEQGSLADLARPGEQLDPPGRRLGQTTREDVSGFPKAEAKVLRRRGRIIIRLWSNIEAGDTKYL
jgi:hypothetical protein